MTVTKAFESIVERMEQHPGEIRPFAEWLHNRPLHNVLEIGVRCGGTAALWHQLSTGTVIGIDWWGADSLGPSETTQLAQEMMHRYPRYQFICGDSHALETFQKVQERVSYVDLIFIDGDHSYKGVQQDWEMYRSLARPGGCIAFHDISDSPFMRSVGHGVPRFWKELKGEKYEFNLKEDWGGIGAIKV